MNLQPLSDRIIVQVEEAKQKSEGGIWIPEGSQERPCRGRVVALGQGRKLDNGERVPMDVVMDDVVLFGKYSGSDIRDGARELRIIREEDVIAIDRGA